MTDKVRFDSSKIPDGYHEIRVVAIANSVLESTGRVVLPVFVDNFGHRVELLTDRKSYSVDDTVKFRVKSNYGERVVLRQNFRNIAEKQGRDVEFSVAASTLGRGPVTLTAVMFDENGIPVSSVPIHLDITGELSDSPRMTEPQRSPNP